MPKRRELCPESVYARLRLERWLEDDLGVSKVHRKRIWKALPSVDVDSIQDIPLAVKENFHSKFVVCTSKVVEEKRSAQGGKLVLETQDGHLIETVLIHHQKHAADDSNKGSGKKRELQAGRTTVCVSSQVGCQMGCTFCATGTLGKIANLTAAEICEQVHHAKLRSTSTTKSWNVVFMGMGEPLDNYQNVKEAIFSLSDPHGFNIPLRRITLSTVGVTHAIHKLAKECPEIQLALSLHAPNEIIRQQIVPTSKGFSLEKIMKALDEYQNNQTRRVMMEYIMIDRINSNPQCAHDLGKLLEGRNCMINLIPYNPTDAGERFQYRCPSNEDIMTFQTIVMENYKGHDGKPIRCTVRWSSAKGQDIDAACGQLALKNVKLNGITRRQHDNGDGTIVPNDIEDIGTHGGKEKRILDSRNKKPIRKSTSKKEKKTPPPPGSGAAATTLPPWFVTAGFCGLATIVITAAMIASASSSAQLWRRGKR